MTAIDMALLIGMVAVVLLAILILVRSGKSDGIAELKAQIAAMDARFGDLQTNLASALGGLREELNGRVESLSTTLAGTLGQIGTAQGERLVALEKQISNARIETQNEATALRTGLLESFAKLGEGQALRLDGFGTSLTEHRTAATTDAGKLREEVAKTLDTFAKRQSESLEKVATEVKAVAEANERRAEALRLTVEGRLDAIRTENGTKLEEMRATVDEKLQSTLTERFNSSFSVLSESLDRVHKSAGEMQEIATGVGDLKRVLTNVKSRGTWGETSLGMLLEQVMTPEQYSQNVEVKPGSGCRVEFAIKMPGDGETPVWLPIDAKLPTEDYERLVDASERGDAAAVEEAARGLERAIRKCGQDIGTKYVDPPHSTDFAIMFLPTEGLFAEVVRRPGLVDSLQRESRVTVAGPTTLMATLVALRSGFRTLAIQKRSSEVWQVLGAVKSEFGKFGGILDKVGKKLAEASKTVEDAGVRRRAVDKRLRDVEALPDAPAVLLSIVADEVEDGPELEAAE